MIKSDMKYYLEQRIKECISEIERTNIKLTTYRDILIDVEKYKEESGG